MWRSGVHPVNEGSVWPSATGLHGNRQQEHPAIWPERRKRRRGSGCHLPGGLQQGSAGLCSPASSDRGRRFAAGSEQTCTLVPGDSHLLLADLSKCRPVSINHIPWAHSLQLHELGDTEMDAFNFKESRKKGRLPNGLLLPWFW